MKQILLFVLSFFLFSTSITAQNAEFAPVGAYWKYTKYAFCGDQQRLVTVVGDTMVSGKTFKKLAIDDFIDDRCPPARTSHIYSRDFLSVRNDSVFMGLNQAFLFNFKAQIGDTIKFKDGFGRKRFGIVDSVGRIDLGGVNRRIMYLTKYCKDSLSGQLTRFRTISKLVENFGLLTEGLLWAEPDCGIVDVSQYIFSCYKSSNFGYPTSVICPQTVATIEPILSQILVAPNPIDTELSINSPSELKLINAELVNYLGQKISVNKVENNQKVNVSAVPNGVYFLTLHFDNQSVVRKIVVQH